MFDNIHTKYSEAEFYINETNAKFIIESLLVDEKNKQMTAEKYAYLSKACGYNGDFQGAIKYAKMAIRLDKDYSYGYVRLAFAYGRLGKVRDTKNALKKLEHLPDCGYYINSILINIYGWLGEVDKAQNMIDRMLELRLDSPDYYYSLGFSFGAKNIDDFASSVVYYEKAKQAGFQNRFDLFYKLMINYGKLSDVENTLKYLNKCLEYGETEDLLERKIQCYLYDSNVSDSLISEIRRFYRLTEDKQQALLYLSEAFKIKNEYARALRYLYFALKITSESAFLYQKIADLFSSEGEYEKAVECYKKALKIDKNDEDVLSGLSYCYSHLKEYELSELYVDKAILLYPDSSYLYYRKGNLYVDMERYEEAVELYKKSLELVPTDVDYYGCVSFAYSKINKFDLSLEYANRGIMVCSEDSYIHFRKGWALQELGKYELAIKSFEKCIEYNEFYVDAYANISYCYSKIGDTKKSIAFANKAILVDKDYAYAHYRKAWMLHYSGRFEDAKESYEAALELNPTDQYSYIGLAATNISLENSLAAIKAANEAIMLDRDCGEAYYFKGLALSLIGKVKEAQTCYAKAMTLGYS